MSKPVQSDEHSGRRSFLRKSITLIPLAGLASYDLTSSRTASSPNTATTSGQTGHAEQRRYKPTFFDAKKWAFINAAVDRIVISFAKLRRQSVCGR